jgi:hypothetical protein
VRAPSSGLGWPARGDCGGGDAVCWRLVDVVSGHRPRLRALMECEPPGAGVSGGIGRPPGGLVGDTERRESGEVHRGGQQ